MLIQTGKILVIFQYLLAKYCNDSKITECCFKLRKQFINIWMFSSQKQTPYFLLLQLYDAAKQAKKSLLKLTEHLELDSKITLKAWSFELT